MCQPRQPGTAADALASVAAGLTALAGLDPADLTPIEQADCLRALERAQARLVAARSAVLAAFTAARGYEDDAAGGPRSWLRWQTRITAAAAADAVHWTQRLAGHPAIASSLAGGQLSVSWARAVCGWTDRLPADARAGADQILLDAAAGGAGLRDLSGLAEEIHRRTAGPDTDTDDHGFDDRSVRLLTHFRGAGKLDGDLTPDCAAMLRAVLDALSAKAGPADTRTAAQREHDALAAGCYRLLAGGLPDRAGQPTQVQLHMSLEQLLHLPGAHDAAADWAGHAPAAGPGAACDAAIAPIVTAHLDPAELTAQASQFLHDTGALAGHASGDASAPGGTPAGQPDSASTSGDADPGSAEADGTADSPGVETSTSVAGPDDPSGASGPDDPSGASGPDDDPSGASGPASCLACASPRGGGRCHVHPPTAAMAPAARDLIVSRAIRLLSGPAGLAAHLRGALLPQPAASISLPLDYGRTTDTAPPSLRRAITARDKHCVFPGCDQPPPYCQAHHLIPVARGGPTTIDNCCLVCLFHHQIAIHRWGWQLSMNPDGTTTARSPDGSKTLHSHAPPRMAG